MASLSTESTPRERLERVVALVKRTRMFWRSSAAIAGIGLAIALVVALQSKRAWRSETTVLYRNAIQTTRNDGDTAAVRSARLGPKLKDLVYARPRLEQVIREFDLFPEKTRKSMLEAVEEMQTVIAFRARGSDSFVISFTYEDPEITQKVTARLTDLMIQEYNRQNIDTATLTRDFLQRELDATTTKVDDASRALATFLGQNPQFQWGMNDSPYAPLPGGVVGAPAIPLLRGPAPRPSGPQDATLLALQRELAQVESALAPRLPGPVAPASPQLVEAQKQRDAAAAAAVAAQATLAERLTALTPAHPDAISAQAKLDAARLALVAAETSLQRARAGAAPEVEGPPLDPKQRASLEQSRAKLRRAINDRRRRLAPAAEAPPPLAAPSGPASEAKAPERAPTVVDLETEWHRLRLELERARDQLRLMQTNAHAADVSADAVEKQSQEEMQILEPAYLPTRPDRGHGRVFFAGAALALLLALGYAAGRVLLNDTLLDEGDVIALGGPQVLVTLPDLPTAPSAPVERTMVPSLGRDDDVDDAAPFPPAPRPAAGRPAVAEPPRASAPPDRPIAPVAPEPSPVEPGYRRDAAITVRFGFPLPAPAPEPQHARSTSTSTSIVVRDAGGLLEAIFDEPEVEVIGADLDPEGDGAFALLRSASPATLAALRVLRHRLEQRRGEGSFVVSVVSPGRGEGKTTLAAELAMTLSEADRARVVLVEGNLERPSVATVLGLRLPEGAGFSTQVRRHMSGRSRPWGVVRLGPSLTVLAESGASAAYPAALHSTHFEGALHALRRAYDYVIIDGPAVLGSGDANVLESVSDGVLLVARAAATKGAALSRATAQLGDRRILGVVLNGVPDLTPAPAAQPRVA
jgi:Mrp family chromosome partitioning ATPase